MSDDIVKRLRVPYDDYLRGPVVEPIKSEAADTIETLCAEVEKLREEIKGFAQQLVIRESVHEDNEFLRAENARLREALKPFAELKPEFDDIDDDEYADALVQMGWIRAARAALGGESD